jgi:hypothetical protein
MTASFRIKTRLYKVYHIHEIGDNDTTKGYIGITRNSLSLRLSQHKRSIRPIGDVLRSGLFQVEITQIGRMLPKEDAMYLEGVLRPNMRMGWNIHCGGNRSNPIWKNGKKTGNITVFCKGHEPHNLGKGERFKLTSPNGEVFYPEYFTIWCRENNLTPQNLRKVAKGLRKHSSGWVAERLSI